MFFLLQIIRAACIHFSSLQVAEHHFWPCCSLFQQIVGLEMLHLLLFRFSPHPANSQDCLHNTVRTVEAGVAAALVTLVTGIFYRQTMPTPHLVVVGTQSILLGE